MTKAQVDCPSCGEKNDYTRPSCQSCDAKLTFLAKASDEDDYWWLGCLIPIVFLVFVTYSCASSDPKESSEFQGKVQGVTAVKEALRDPSSADFSGTYISSTGNYCGYVNAANGFGGMSGDKRFIVIGGTAVIDEGEGFEGLWINGCAR